MKFKVGERARIIGPCKPGEKDWWGVSGKACTVADLSPMDPRMDYSVLVDGVDARQFGSATVTFQCREIHLRKLLPDSDTYHPADISIDDLMHTIKTPETVT